MIKIDVSTLPIKFLHWEAFRISILPPSHIESVGGRVFLFKSLEPLQSVVNKSSSCNKSHG